MSSGVPAAVRERLSGVAGAVWWLGVPMLIVGWFVAGGATGGAAPEVIFTVANALWPVSPLTAELIAHYPLTLLATVALTLVLTWQIRVRGAARLDAFLLPSLGGGLESWVRLESFLSCRGGIPPPLAEIHQDLHVAAMASLVAMTLPLLAAAVLALRGCGALTRTFALTAVAATASVELMWAFYDVLLSI